MLRYNSNRNNKAYKRKWVLDLIGFYESYLLRYGISEVFSLRISKLLALISILTLYILVDLVTKKIVLAILKKHIKKSPNKWDDILLENKFFDRVALTLPATVIYIFAPIFPSYEGLIQRVVFAYISLITILVLNSIIDTVEDIYRKFEVSKTKPIKGYLQVLQMIVWVLGLIIIVSIIIDRSPIILLSGIGAATAVLLLVFQNSILGLVASIQLTSNNMLKIGDWISMPSYDADGDVLEISLHTVKIQNWDKTIVTVPTYKMTSESFVNWKGMVNSGGRRIKRAIYIDLSSIKFCSQDMLDRFEEIEYLKHYLAVKKNDVSNYNKQHHINDNNPVNGRRLTNIGTFRAYIEAYLKQHPGLNKDMTLMVRQLQPTEKGLPLEIYAFTDGTAWMDYENIQSDIFDHILSIVAEFDLRVYQSPTGYDLKEFTITK